MVGSNLRARLDRLEQALNPPAPLMAWISLGRDGANVEVNEHGCAMIHVPNPTDELAGTMMEIGPGLFRLDQEGGRPSGGLYLGGFSPAMDESEACDWYELLDDSLDAEQREAVRSVPYTIVAVCFEGDWVDRGRAILEAEEQSEAEPTRRQPRRPRGPDPETAAHAYDGPWRGEEEFTDDEE